MIRMMDFCYSVHKSNKMIGINHIYHQNSLLLDDYFITLLRNKKNMGKRLYKMMFCLSLINAIVQRYNLRKRTTVYTVTTGTTLRGCMIK